MTDITVTFFPNFAAATKRELALDPAELARRIETTTGPEKTALPWLKLARFGDRRSDKHSLRHDANVLTITGIEADYDAEQLGFGEAVERLRTAGLLAIVYTSPSHTEDGPRWRVLCPLSAEYPPALRDWFLAQLNGLFGGAFARESWTLSQSYWFGSVRNNPSHRVELLAGMPIDLATDLYAIAIDRPEKSAAENGADGHHDGDGQHDGADPAAITNARIAGIIAALLNNVRNAADGTKHYTLRANGIALGGYIARAGWSEAEAVKALVEALPDSVKDKALAKRTATWAVAQGKGKPQALPPDRPYGEGRWPA